MIESLVADLDAALLSSHTDDSHLFDFAEDDDLLQNLMEDYLDKLENLERYVFGEIETSSAIEDLIIAYNDMYYQTIPSEQSFGFKLLLNFMRKPLEQILQFLQPYVWEDKPLSQLQDDSLYLNYDAELDLLKSWLSEYNETSSLAAARALTKKTDDNGWYKIAAAFALGWWIGKD